MLPFFFITIITFFIREFLFHREKLSQRGFFSIILNKNKGKNEVNWEIIYILMNKSKDEVKELFAISVCLSTEDGDEDEDDDIVGNVTWVFNDGVRDQKDDSDVFEAVGGQHEGDS